MMPSAVRILAKVVASEVWEGSGGCVGIRDEAPKATIQMFRGPTAIPQWGDRTGLMTHTVLAGQVGVGGRPWGDGETLLVPVGQQSLKLDMLGRDYAVVLSVYHQLARAPTGAQPDSGRALIQIMGAGMKPVTLETVTVEVLEGARRGLRIAPPGTSQPWRPTATSLDMVRLLQNRGGAHHLRLRLTKSSATLATRGGWAGWAKPWVTFIRGLQPSAPPELTLTFMQGDGALARRAADALTAQADSTTPKKATRQGGGPGTPQ